MRGDRDGNLGDEDLAVPLTRARLAAVLESADAMSVLARLSPARLVNVSASGCLLETATYLEPGTTGALTVVVGGETYDDAVRVIRVGRKAGAGVAWQIGVEFLWTNRPGSWSLRRMVSRLRREIPPDVTVGFSAVGPN